MTAKELLISELESTAESLQKKIASRQQAIDHYYNFNTLKDMQMSSEKDYAVQKNTGAKLAQLYDEIIYFEAALNELKTIIFFQKRKS